MIKKINPQNTNDYTDKLFCYNCLAFPHYSIEVRDDGIIFLNHLCKGEIKRINFEKDYKKYEQNEIKCYNCQTNCNIICIKCDSYMCNKCVKYHFNYIYIDETESEEEENEKDKINEEEDIDEESEEEKKLLYVPILEMQFICKIHQMKFTHYCELCKINLCNECIINHFHINNNKFLEIKKNQELNKYLEAKNENEIINKLLLISKIFNDCYISNKNKNLCNINIMLNYQLIKNIILFIDNYTTNKKINEGNIISNDIIKTKNKNYLFKSFMSDSFQEYYDILIKRIQIGHIDSYKIFQNIGKNYKIHEKNISNVLRIINQGYNLSLTINANDSKFNISFIEDIMQSSIFFLYAAKITKLYEKIDLQIHIIQYNYEIIKNIIIEVNYKLDFESRRKAGNLLIKEIINKYYNNLEKLKITKYRLMQSIKIIKQKIIQNNNNNELKKENIEKLEKCKNLFIKNINEDFDNVKIDKIEDEKDEIIFININNSQNEKLKVILLNLFILIRKELNSKFNISIHNETQKINSMIDNIKKQENKKKKQKKIFDKKNEEKNLLCTDKLKIIELIKQKIKTKKVIRKEDIDFENLFSFMNISKKDDISRYTENEFIIYLEECKKLYDLDTRGNLENTMLYYIYGDKKNLMVENKYYENKEKIIKEIETIENKINKEKKIQQFVIKINKLLNNNIKDLNETIMEEVNLLAEYKNYININNILKKNYLKKEIDALKLIKKLNIDINAEDKFILYTILTILIIENYINKIKEIKMKIKNLNLEEFHNEIKKKIEIIEYFKLQLKSPNKPDFFNDIWNEFKKKDIFINNDNEYVKDLNKEIKKYIINNNEEKFINDFIKLMKDDIECIDFSEQDPKNYDIIAFMRQYKLDV